MVVFARVGLSEGMAVADLGCGTGFFSLPASKIVGEQGQVFAVDKVKEVLDVLKSKIEKEGMNNIVVRQTDISSSAIDDHSIDLIIMTNVFHDAHDDATLKECLRIIKEEDGKFLIIDWKKTDTGEGPPLEYRLDPKEVMEILAKKGWHVVDSFEPGSEHYALVAKFPRP
jgi:ubiquinone/menaquinone biosynthesis C-methylase UbiE